MANTNKLSYNKLKDKILKLEKELNKIKDSQNNTSYSQLINELYELIKKNKELSESENQLLKDKELREHMGQKAREKVRQHFLLIRYLEQYLDLLNSFEASFKLTNRMVTS